VPLLLSGLLVTHSSRLGATESNSIYYYSIPMHMSQAMTGIYYIAQVLTLVGILNLYYFVLPISLGGLDSGLTSSSSKITETLKIQCMQLNTSPLTFGLQVRLVVLRCC